MPIRTMAITIIATLQLSTVAAYGQDETTLTLADAVRMTFEKDSTLRRFPLKTEAVLGQREIAALRPAISVDMEAENILGTGDLGDLSSAELSLSLSGVVEMGAKQQARLDVNDRKLALIDAEQEISELDLLADVAFRFLDVVIAQERLALRETATQISQDTISAVENLVNAGRVPEAELLRVQADAELNQLAVNRAEAALQAARVDLSTLWQSQNPIFDHAVSDFFLLEELPDINSLLMSLSENPALELYANEDRLLASRLHEIESRQNSDIAWSAGIRHSREINDTGLMFGFSIPLGTRERTTGEVRTVNANREELALRQEAAVNSMKGQLISLYIQLEQAAEQVSRYNQEVLPLLNESLTATQSAYERGSYRYTDLLNAQQAWLNARFALVESAAQAHRLQIEIERLSGQPMTGSNRRTQ